jgi:hypothetical protein
MIYIGYKLMILIIWYSIDVKIIYINNFIVIFNEINRITIIVIINVLIVWYDKKLIKIYDISPMFIMMVMIIIILIKWDDGINIIEKMSLSTAQIKREITIYIIEIWHYYDFKNTPMLTNQIKLSKHFIIFRFLLIKNSKIPFYIIH